jgi:hypothetical protein
MENILQLLVVCFNLKKNCKFENFCIKDTFSVISLSNFMVLFSILYNPNRS